MGSSDRKKKVDGRTELRGTLLFINFKDEWWLSTVAVIELLERKTEKRLGSEKEKFGN